MAFWQALLTAGKLEHSVVVILCPRIQTVKLTLTQFMTPQIDCGDTIGSIGWGNDRVIFCNLTALNASEQMCLPGVFSSTGV